MSTRYVWKSTGIKQSDTPTYKLGDWVTTTNNIALNYTPTSLKIAEVGRSYIFDESTGKISIPSPNYFTGTTTYDPDTGAMGQWYSRAMSSVSSANEYIVVINDAFHTIVTGASGEWYSLPRKCIFRRQSVEPLGSSWGWGIRTGTLRQEEEMPGTPRRYYLNSLYQVSGNTFPYASNYMQYARVEESYPYVSDNIEKGRKSSTDRNTYQDDYQYDSSTWLTYLGSDSIDASSLKYSTNKPRGGDEITITVKPSTKTQYGGTIGYQWYYNTTSSTNSGWVEWGEPTTETSKTYTIPRGTPFFNVRVQAMDNLGFTSSDYTTGGILTVINIRAYIGVDGKARKIKKIYIGVNDKAREVKGGYVGVDGKARRWF